MSYAALKKTAQRLQNQAGFVVEITDSEQYEEAMALMDQHELGGADLPEIGSKSLVSKILNERDRQLTRQHRLANHSCLLRGTG